MMKEKKFDISNKPSPHTFRIKVARILWYLVQISVFRLVPNPLHKLRILILRAFGGNISLKARVSRNAKITMPWNLTMLDYATLGPFSICYSTAPITIGKQSTVSQYSYLCTATHDYEDSYFTLYAEPIVIGEDVWVAADCFVGPGVTIADGTVIGSRSSIYKDTNPWRVYVGNPARELKNRRILRDRSNEKSRLPNQ